MKCTATEQPDDIDIEYLNRKYAQERGRRLRTEGARQYIEAEGGLSGYYELDPYSPPVVRGAISDEVDVAIIGGGFAGLIAGARLRQAGISNLRIIEMGGDFGGTWYWNRYPGVQCDVESYTYLPLLEELNYIPKEKFSYGPEVFDYCRRIAKHFDLYETAIFGTIVRALRWDESIKRCRIGTNHGDDIRARFVVLAAGCLNKPKLPGIPGIETFEGHSFHTSRWDYDYTGGDTNGGLVKLADKRVALIGTGSTGVQCVPFLGRYAKRLYVFQRTPSSIGERGNYPTDPRWAKALQPGWQLQRQRNFHAGVFEGLASPDADLLCDGWGEINRNVAAKLIAMGNPTVSPAELAKLREMEDHKLMERLRRRIDDIVANKQTAETLKPWYRFFCKRPCFSDDYLKTFNQPNVELIDVSASKGVEKVTKKGVVANGTEYEVDCIIYASGFEITNDHRRRLGIETIEGREGVSLYDHWGNGYKTFHGMSIHGFPNFFYMGYSQTATVAAHNLRFEQQGSHIAHIIKELISRGIATAEPSQEAEDAWCTIIQQSLVANPQILACTPGYLNNEGTGRSALYGEPYGPGFYAFDRLLKDWRDKSDMEGFVLGS